MDSSAVWKRANIRSTNALTASSANGVLICGAADVLIRVDTIESPTNKPNLISPRHERKLRRESSKSPRPERSTEFTPKAQAGGSP